MPPRLASQPVDTQPVSLDVLVERVKNLESRIDEKLEDLRSFLGGKLDDICAITKDHETRLGKAEKQLTELQMIRAFLIFIGVLFAGSLFALLWAIFTHSIEIVAH